MRLSINYKTFNLSEAALVELNNILHRADVSVIDKQRDGKWKTVTTGEANPTLTVNQTVEWEGSED